MIASDRTGSNGTAALDGDAASGARQGASTLDAGAVRRAGLTARVRAAPRSQAEPPATKVDGPEASPLPAATSLEDGLKGHFIAPPPDPPLNGKTVPYLPRGVRLADDPVRGLRVLQAPERALQLDPVGEAILTSLDGRTLDEIVAELAARYDAPEAVILSDVASFLDDLIARRMVFVRSA